MKPSRDVRADMPDNEGAFSDPFFARFTLRPGASLELDGGVRKTYPFPTFYHDVGCAIGIFFCDHAAASRLMPHPRLVPVRMTHGRTLVIFSCYEYRQVMKVWPYNEIAMSIPVMADAGFHPPVLPMLMSGLFPRFGYHVFSMPVTSRENQLRGNKLWGLPKITQRIDISREGGTSVTRAFEDDGTQYFELRVPTLGPRVPFDVKGHLYSQLDGKILKAATCFKGDFAVHKHMRALRTPGLVPATPVLSIGDSPSAQALRDLRIEQQPFQTRYCNSMNAAFDLPITGFEMRAP